MESKNPNPVKNACSLKAYTLVIMFFIFATISILPYISNFQDNRGCEAYLNLSKVYNFSPSPCVQYVLQKYVVPSVATILPFGFSMIVTLSKEKNKKYRLVKSKQQKSAFWLTILAALIFLLSIVLIRGISCEGFGCLGLGPLIAVIIIIFPPLIFGSFLWFLLTRYQWGKRQFLAIAITQVVLVFVAYIQTPLF